MGIATLTFPEGGDLLDEEEAALRLSAQLEIGKRQVGTSRIAGSRGSNARWRGQAAPGTRHDLTPSERSPSPTAAARGEENGELRAERRLLRAIRRGDERAFTRLVLAYQDRVYGTCLRMLRRRDEAEDTTQDVFISLHRHLSSFRGEARLATFIYKVTRNHCLNRLKYLERRQEEKRTAFDSADIEARDPISGAGPKSPEEHLQGLELQGVLEEALGVLPDEHRLLVILRDVQGLSYEELVEITDLPLGTVKSRLHRARLSLATTLKEWREACEEPGLSNETPTESGETG